MEHSMKRLLIAAAAGATSAVIAHAEDPIVGKTELGDTAAIASCGGGYCITLESGTVSSWRRRSPEVGHNDKGMTN
jgi:uncharacterized protein (DUF2147 family)